MRVPRLRSTAFVVALLAVGTGLSACGSRQTSSQHARVANSGATLSSTTARQPSRPTIRASVTIAKLGELPAAVADAASVSLGADRIVLLGGVTPADTSTGAITLLAGGQSISAGTLPTPQHDAEAARLGHDVYIFGGGEFSTFDHILRYDPTTHRVSTAGRLPSTASDVAVASLGGAAYIVGGFDGSQWLDSILAWRPSTGPELAARLSVGLRYAAIASVGGRILIVGGTTPTGVSDAILSFDPVTRKVTEIGHLRIPVTHASAAEFAGRVLVIGGRRSVTGEQTAAILDINPVSGAVRRIGRLPQPLSDSSVAAEGNRLIVAGGQTAAGPQRTILTLTPHLP